GNSARFINHSCEPNCQLQKWIVGRENRIGIFAIKDIAAGSELTFDYAMECYGMKTQKCYCGEATCRGLIVSKDTLAPKTVKSQREIEIEQARKRHNRNRANVASVIRYISDFKYTKQLQIMNKRKLFLTRNIRSGFRLRWLQHVLIESEFVKETTTDQLPDELSSELGSVLSPYEFRRQVEMYRRRYEEPTSTSTSSEQVEPTVKPTGTKKKKREDKDAVAKEEPQPKRRRKTLDKKNVVDHDKDNKEDKKTKEVDKKSKEDKRPTEEKETKKEAKKKEEKKETTKESKKEDKKPIEKKSVENVKKTNSIVKKIVTPQSGQYDGIIDATPAFTFKIPKKKKEEAPMLVDVASNSCADVFDPVAILNSVNNMKIPGLGSPSKPPPKSSSSLQSPPNKPPTKDNHSNQKQHRESIPEYKSSSKQQYKEPTHREYKYDTSSRSSSSNSSPHKKESYRRESSDHKKDYKDIEHNKNHSNSRNYTLDHNHSRSDWNRSDKSSHRDYRNQDRHHHQGQNRK
ncbi:Setd2, partial [Acrasis kona]